MYKLVITTLAIASISLVANEAWARRYSLSHDQVAHVCSTMSAGAPGYSNSTDCIKCSGSNCRNYYCNKQTGKCYELVLRPGSTGKGGPAVCGTGVGTKSGDRSGDHYAGMSGNRVTGTAGNTTGYNRDRDHRGQGPQPTQQFGHRVEVGVVATATIRVVGQVPTTIATERKRVDA
jgi:hypothetical protein